MRGRAGVMAARHQNDIVVLDSHRFIQRAVIGIDTLDAKTLRRIQPVVIAFFQIGDTGIIILVMPVAWIA